VTDGILTRTHARAHTHTHTRAHTHTHTHTHTYTHTYTHTNQIVHMDIATRFGRSQHGQQFWYSHPMGLAIVRTRRVHVCVRRVTHRHQKCLVHRTIEYQHTFAFFQLLNQIGSAQFHRVGAVNSRPNKVTATLVKVGFNASETRVGWGGIPLVSKRIAMWWNAEKITRGERRIFPQKNWDHLPWFASLGSKHPVGALSKGPGQGIQHRVVLIRVSVGHKFTEILGLSNKTKHLATNHTRSNSSFTIDKRRDSAG
jgi:hypothetical protein